MAGKDLKMDYGTDWEAYLNDSAHPQFKEFLASLKAKLTTVGAPKKGVGKGKSKQKSGKKFIKNS